MGGRIAIVEVFSKLIHVPDTEPISISANLLLRVASHSETKQLLRVSISQEL